MYTDDEITAMGFECLEERLGTDDTDVSSHTS